MEASELRIGNFVYLELGLPSLNVHCICKEDFVVIDDKVSPIPLTEEWLLKFGFEKHKNEMQIDGREFILSIDDDKTYFSSCGKLGGGLVVLCLCGGNYFAKNLEYVHQLQNLYYALTSEELTLKTSTASTTPQESQ